MKKGILFTFTFLLVCIIGCASVYASSQTIYDNTNYKISSGKTTVGSWNAKYDYAMADIQPTSITSGTAKTAFQLYRYTGSYYALRISKTTGISTGVSWYESFGNLGSGDWMIKNYASNYGSTTTKYAGWSGTLRYLSTD